MRFDRGTGNVKFFQLRFRVQLAEDSIQLTVIPPFAEATVYGFVGTEPFEDDFDASKTLRC